MDEDRLSPVLGRLIDQAKSAARAVGGVAPETEGVALLVDEGIVHSAAVAPSAASEEGDRALVEGGGPVASAAQLALESARAAGGKEILAAAVAAPFSRAETVLPSAGSYECLVGVDAELPLVLKQDGRWVMLPASRVTPEG